MWPQSLLTGCCSVQTLPLKMHYVWVKNWGTWGRKGWILIPCSINQSFICPEQLNEHIWRQWVGQDSQAPNWNTRSCPYKVYQLKHFRKLLITSYISSYIFGFQTMRKVSSKLIENCDRIGERTDGQRQTDRQTEWQTDIHDRHKRFHNLSHAML